MDKFEIKYLDIEKNKEYEEIIKKVVEECFKVEGLEDSKLYISITLTTPENIRKYNKEYRNIDKETDVLSFPMFEKAGMPIEEAISGYVFNMMESYYKNAGFIPKAISDVIIEQIYEAVKQTKYSSYLQNLEQFKYKTYWAFTHR